MDVKKTSRLSLVEQVTGQINELIKSGQWAVGYRLPPEPLLSEELGVSRNTLREAIRALVHSGLIVTKPGDGTYVISSSVLGVAIKRRLEESTLLETLEVRNALERETAALAALRRTKSEMQRIQSYLTVCEKAAKANDLESYVEADMALHKSIAEAAHNPLFLELYEHVTEYVHMSIGNMIALYEQLPHRKLVQAIHEKNSILAASAVDEYIEEFRKIIKSTMEE
ncbi:FadR/GntR family transcriptional regulator [Metabacillus sp. RGM 3146]|uniref:FadR/GntR family transcriptional regulator n=1 Tax=Metabacillus sp. RGM 3146 TaxID=3401092 RepID=UPI003B9BC572